MKIAEGDSMSVGERDTTWPAFIYVVAEGGEGWVPHRHLDIDADRAIVTVGYDTTELSLDRNQEVMVLRRDDESGWWWCRATDGSEGWVPIEALEIID